MKRTRIKANTSYPISRMISLRRIIPMYGGLHSMGVPLLNNKVPEVVKTNGQKCIYSERVYNRISHHSDQPSPCIRISYTL